MELKYLFAAVLIFLWSQNLTAQDDFPKPYGPQPEIGKPMPEFTLDNVKYFSKTEVSLKDFKGKWLFLDFWFTGCAACVRSFPKVNTLQLQFKDEVQFLLVGINEEKFSYGKGIESMYEKYALKQNLVIAAAFDSTLVFRWGLRSFPHIIIIDPDGIVRSITNGQNLTADGIKELIRGEPASFFPKDVERSDFDPTTTDDNKYVIYRSVLTKWNGEKERVPELKYYLKFKAGQKADYQIAMVPLYKIYNVAYTGSAHWTRMDSLYEKVYPHPVLEMKDTFQFQHKGP